MRAYSSLPANNARRYSLLVNDPAIAIEQDSIAGLCSRCVNARRIESARGSTFILCELSRTNPLFAKYPRLPVLSCDGFQSLAESPKDRS